MSAYADDPNTFKLGEKEVAKIKAWTDEHEKTCPTPKRATTWGRWAYVFIPTGIIDMARIRCLLCDKEEDVTTYPTLEALRGRRKVMP